MTWLTRRLISAFLAVIMLASIPASAFEASGESNSREQGYGTYSEPVEPESTEPGRTEQESTEPGSAEQESSEPGSAEQESTEPGSAEQESSEPDSTEAKNTEPVSTEPDDPGDADKQVNDSDKDPEAEPPPNDDNDSDTQSDNDNNLLQPFDLELELFDVPWEKIQIMGYIVPESFEVPYGTEFDELKENELPNTIKAVIMVSGENALEGEALGEELDEEFDENHYVVPADHVLILREFGEDFELPEGFGLFIRELDVEWKPSPDYDRFKSSENELNFVTFEFIDEEELYELYVPLNIPEGEPGDEPDLPNIDVIIEAPVFIITKYSLPALYQLTPDVPFGTTISEIEDIILPDHLIASVTIRGGLNDRVVRYFGIRIDTEWDNVTPYPIDGDTPGDYTFTASKTSLDLLEEESLIQYTGVDDADGVINIPGDITPDITVTLEAAVFTIVKLELPPGFEPEINIPYGLSRDELLIEYPLPEFLVAEVIVFGGLDDREILTYTDIEIDVTWDVSAYPEEPSAGDEEDVYTLTPVFDYDSFDSFDFEGVFELESHVVAGAAIVIGDDTEVPDITVNVPDPTLKVKEFDPLAAGVVLYGTPKLYVINEVLPETLEATARVFSPYGFLRTEKVELVHGVHFNWVSPGYNEFIPGMYTFSLELIKGGLPSNWFFNELAELDVTIEVLPMIITGFLRDESQPGQELKLADLTLPFYSVIADAKLSENYSTIEAYVYFYQTGEGPGEEKISISPVEWVPHPDHESFDGRTTGVVYRYVPVWAVENSLSDMPRATESSLYMFARADDDRLDKFDEISGYVEVANDLPYIDLDVDFVPVREVLLKCPDHPDCDKCLPCTETSEPHDWSCSGNDISEQTFNYGVTYAEICLPSKLYAEILILADKNEDSDIPTGRSAPAGFTYVYRLLEVTWKNDEAWDDALTGGRILTPGEYEFTATIVDTGMYLPPESVEFIIKVTVEPPVYIIQWFHSLAEEIADQTGARSGHIDYDLSPTDRGVDHGTTLATLKGSSSPVYLPDLSARVYLYDRNHKHIPALNTDIEIKSSGQIASPGEAPYGTVDWGSGLRPSGDHWDTAPRIPAYNPVTYPTDGNRPGIYTFTAALDLPANVLIGDDPSLPDKIRHTEPVGLPDTIDIELLRKHFDGNLIVGLGTTTGSGSLQEFMQKALFSLFAYEHEVHTVTVTGGGSFTITAPAPVYTPLPPTGGAGTYLNSTNWPSLDTLNLYGFDGTLGTAAFSNNSILKTVSLKPGVRIPTDAFRNNTALRTMGFSPAVTSKNLDTIDNTGGIAKNLVDLNDVSALGIWAFAGCSAMTAVRLPKGLSNIGERVFDGAVSLQLIILSAPRGVAALANTFMNIPRQVMIVRDDDYSSDYIQLHAGSGVPSGFGVGRYVHLPERFAYVGEAVTMDAHPVINPAVMGLKGLSFEWFYAPTLDVTGNLAGPVSIGTTHTIPRTLDTLGLFGFYQLKLTLEIDGETIVHTTNTMRFADIESEVRITTPRCRDPLQNIEGFDEYPMEPLLTNLRRDGSKIDETPKLLHHFPGETAGYIWTADQYAEIRIYNLGDPDAGGISLTDVNITFKDGAASPFQFNRELVIGTRMVSVVPPNRDFLIDNESEDTYANVRVWPKMHLFPGIHTDELIIESAEGVKEHILLTFEVTPHDLAVTTKAATFGAPPDWKYDDKSAVNEEVWVFPTRTAGYLVDETVNRNNSSFSGTSIIPPATPLADGTIGYVQFDIKNLSKTRTMMGIREENIYFALRAESPFMFEPRQGGPLYIGDAQGTGGSATSVLTADGTVNIRVRPKSGLKPGSYSDTMYIRGQDGFQVVIPFEFTVEEPDFKVSVRAGTKAPTPAVELCHDFLTTGVCLHAHPNIEVVFPERGYGYIQIDNSDPDYVLGSRQISIENKSTDGTSAIAGIKWYFESSTVDQEPGFIPPFVIDRELMRGVDFGPSRTSPTTITGTPLAPRDMIQAVPSSENRHGNIRVAPRLELPIGTHTDVLIIKAENGFILEIPISIKIVDPYFDVEARSSAGNILLASSQPATTTSLVIASRAGGYFPFYDNDRINNASTNLRVGPQQINLRNIGTTPVRELSWGWKSLGTAAKGTNVTTAIGSGTQIAINAEARENSPFIVSSRGLRIGRSTTISETNIPVANRLMPDGFPISDSTTLTGDARFDNSTANIRVRPHDGLRPRAEPYEDVLVIYGDGFELEIPVEFHVTDPIFDIEVTVVTKDGRVISTVSSYDLDGEPMVVTDDNALVFPDKYRGYGNFLGGDGPNSQEWYSVNNDNGHRQIILKNISNTNEGGAARVMDITNARTTWEKGEASPFIITKHLTAYASHTAAYALRNWIPVTSGDNDPYVQLWIRPKHDLEAGKHKDILILEGDYGFKLHIPVEFEVRPPIDGFLSVSPMSWTFTTRDEGYRLMHGLDAGPKDPSEDEAGNFRTGYAQFNLSNWGAIPTEAFTIKQTVTQTDTSIGGFDRLTGALGAYINNEMLHAGSGGVTPVSDGSATVYLEKDDGVGSSPFVIYRGLASGHGLGAGGVEPFATGDISTLGTELETMLGNIRVMPRFGLEPSPLDSSDRPIPYEDNLIINIAGLSLPIKINLKFSVLERPGLKLTPDSLWDSPIANTPKTLWGRHTDTERTYIGHPAEIPLPVSIPIWSFAPVFEGYGKEFALGVPGMPPFRAGDPSTAAGAAFTSGTWSLMERGGAMTNRGGTVGATQLSATMIEISNSGRDRVHDVTGTFKSLLDGETDENSTPFIIQRGLSTHVSSMVQLEMGQHGPGNLPANVRGNWTPAAHTGSIFLQAHVSRVDVSDGDESDITICCERCEMNIGSTWICDPEKLDEEGEEELVPCCDYCCFAPSDPGGGASAEERIDPRRLHYRIRPRENLPPGKYEDIFVVMTEHGVEIEVLLRFEVLPLKLKIETDRRDKDGDPKLHEGNPVTESKLTNWNNNTGLSDVNFATFVFAPRQVGFVPGVITNDEEAGPQQFNLTNLAVPSTWSADGWDILGTFKHRATHPTLRLERLEWEFESVLNGTKEPDEKDEFGELIPDTGTTPFVINRGLTMGSALNTSPTAAGTGPNWGEFPGADKIAENPRGRSSYDWTGGIWANVGESERTVHGIRETGLVATQPPVSNIRIEPRLELGYDENSSAVQTFTDTLVIWHPTSTKDNPLARIPLSINIEPLDLEIYSKQDPTWNKGTEYNWTKTQLWTFEPSIPGGILEYKEGEDLARFIIKNNGGFPITGLGGTPGFESFVWDSVEKAAAQGKTTQAPFQVWGPSLYTGHDGRMDKDEDKTNRVEMKIGEESGESSFFVHPRENLSPGTHTDTLYIRNKGGFQIAITFTITIAEYSFDVQVEEFIPREHGFSIDLAKDTRIIEIKNNSPFTVRTLYTEFWEINERFRDENGYMPGYDIPDDLETWGHPNIGRYFNIQGGQLLDHWNFAGGFHLNADGSIKEEDGIPVRVSAAHSIAPAGQPGDTVYLIIRAHESLGEGHFREYLRLYNDFHFETFIPFDFTVINNVYVLLADPVFVDFGEIYYRDSNTYPTTITLTNAGNTDLVEYFDHNFTFAPDDRGVWGGGGSLNPFRIIPPAGGGAIIPTGVIYRTTPRTFDVELRDYVKDWAPGTYTATLQIFGKNEQADVLSILFSVTILPPSADLSTNMLTFDRAGVGFDEDDAKDRALDVSIRNLMQIEGVPAGELSGVKYEWVSWSAVDTDGKPFAPNLGGNHPFEVVDVEYDDVSGDGIAGGLVGKTGVFTIQPRHDLDLPPGTYTAAIRIKYDHEDSGFNGTVLLSFTVDPHEGQLSPGNLIWATRPAGYSLSEVPAQRVYIHNQSSLWGFDLLDIKLSGVNASDFVIVLPAGKSLSEYLDEFAYIDNSSTNKFIEVRPRTGLAVGTYEAVLTVTVGNGSGDIYTVDLPASLFFTVTVPGVSAQISPISLTWDAKGFGYSTRPEQRIAVTNTGDRELVNLTAGFVSDDFEVIDIQWPGAVGNLKPFRDNPGGAHTAYILVRPVNDLIPGVYNDNIIIRAGTLINAVEIPNVLMESASVSYEVLLPETRLTPSGAVLPDIDAEWPDTDANYAPRPVFEFVLENISPEQGKLSNVSAVLTNTNFEFVGFSGTRDVPAGGTTSWFVRPRTGLVPADYTAGLIITGDFGIYESASLKFTVNPARASVTPIIHDWGLLTAGYLPAGAPVQQFRIVNNGDSPLPALVVSLDGDAGSAFILRNTIPVNEFGEEMTGGIPEKGGSGFIYVEPKPGLLLGAYTDNLHIFALDGEMAIINDAPNIRIPLTLTVVPPTATATPVGVDFSATVGYTATQATAMRRNIEISRSTNPYMITGINASFAGGSSGVFSVASGIPSTMAPGQSFTLQVQPVPGCAPGFYTDVLNIRGDNDFVLDIPVTFAVSAYDASANPSPVVFDDRVVGYRDRPDWETVTVTSNVADTPLSGIQIRLGSGDHFELRPKSGGSLPTFLPAQGNGALEFEVIPKPGLPLGLYTDTVLLTSSAASANFYMAVGLVFEVVEPYYAAELSETEHIWMPTAYIGYDSKYAYVQDFTVTNTGTGDLTGLRAYLRFGSSFLITSQLSSTDIPADGTTTPANGTSVVSVRPHFGLPPGVYSDALVVTDLYGRILLEADLHFAVSAFGNLDISEGFWTFGDLVEGYTDEDREALAKIFEVVNGETFGFREVKAVLGNGELSSFEIVNWDVLNDALFGVLDPDTNEPVDDLSYGLFREVKVDDDWVERPHNNMSSRIDVVNNRLQAVVQPKADLLPGTHTDRLIITGYASEKGLGAFVLIVPLAFFVEYPPFDYEVDPDDTTPASPAEFDEFDADDESVHGTKTPDNLPPVTVTLKNKGSRPISGLSAFLAMGDRSPFVLPEDGLSGSASATEEATGVFTILGKDAAGNPVNEYVYIDIRPAEGLRGGIYTDTLIFTGDDGFFEAVHLSFTVLGPPPTFVAEIIEINGNAYNSATNSRIDFDMYVGENPSGHTQSITIKNTGTGDLMFSSLSLVVQPSSDFEIVSGLPFLPGRLLPGETYTHLIEIQPTDVASKAVGTYSGSLEIRYENIPVGLRTDLRTVDDIPPVYTIPLRTVIKPYSFEISMVPITDVAEPHRFSLYLGENPAAPFNSSPAAAPAIPHTRQVEIKNTSDRPLAVDDLRNTFDMGLFTIAGWPAPGTEIAPGDTVTFTIRPAAAAIMTGTSPDVIKLYHKDGTPGANTTIDLVLQIIPPSFTVTPAETMYFTYYRLENKEDHQKTITITNTSRVPLYFDPSRPLLPTETLMRLGLISDEEGKTWFEDGYWDGIGWLGTSWDGDELAPGAEMTFVLRPTDDALLKNDEDSTTRKNTLRVWHNYSDPTERELELYVSPVNFSLSVTPASAAISIFWGEDPDDHWFELTLKNLSSRERVYFDRGELDLEDILYDLTKSFATVTSLIPGPVFGAGALFEIRSADWPSTKAVPVKFLEPNKMPDGSDRTDGSDSVTFRIYPTAYAVNQIGKWEDTLTIVNPRGDPHDTSLSLSLEVKRPEFSATAANTELDLYVGEDPAKLSGSPASYTLMRPVVITNNSDGPLRFDRITASFDNPLFEVYGWSDPAVIATRGGTQTIYVKMTDAPTNAQIGLHTGTLTLEHDDGAIQTITFTIEVMPVNIQLILPDPAEMFFNPFWGEDSVYGQIKKSITIKNLSTRMPVDVEELGFAFASGLFRIYDPIDPGEIDPGENFTFTIAPTEAALIDYSTINTAKTDTFKIDYLTGGATTVTIALELLLKASELTISTCDEIAFYQGEDLEAAANLGKVTITAGAGYIELDKLDILFINENGDPCDEFEFYGFQFEGCEIFELGTSTGVWPDVDWTTVGGVYWPAGWLTKGDLPANREMIIYFKATDTAGDTVGSRESKVEIDLYDEEGTPVGYYSDVTLTVKPRTFDIVMSPAFDLYWRESHTREVTIRNKTTLPLDLFALDIDFSEGLFTVDRGFEAGDVLEAWDGSGDYPYATFTIKPTNAAVDVIDAYGDVRSDTLIIAHEDYTSAYAEEELTLNVRPPDFEILNAPPPGRSTVRYIDFEFYMDEDPNLYYRDVYLVNTGDGPLFINDSDEGYLDIFFTSGVGSEFEYEILAEGKDKIDPEDYITIRIRATATASSLIGENRDDVLLIAHNSDKYDRFDALGWVNLRLDILPPEFEIYPPDAVEISVYDDEDLSLFTIDFIIKNTGRSDIRMEDLLILLHDPESIFIVVDDDPDLFTGTLGPDDEAVISLRFATPSSLIVGRYDDTLEIKHGYLTQVVARTRDITIHIDPAPFVGGGPGVVISLQITEDELEEEPDVNETGRKPVWREGISFTETHHYYMIGTDDVSICPTSLITRAEVATIMFRILSHNSRVHFWALENSFEDVDQGKWYNNQISTISVSGLMIGYNDNEFGPTDIITRAQVAMLLSRLVDVDPSTAPDAGFTDVSDNHWAKDAINLAAEYGWMIGPGNNLFNPDAYITRAEFAVLINRLLDRSLDVLPDLEDMITWDDNTDQQTWYYDAMQIASNSSHGVPLLNWAALQKPNATPYDLYLPVR